MGKTFVICDQDTEYAGKLSDYMSRRKAGMYEVRSYSSVDSMMEDLAGICVDFLLISDEMHEKYKKSAGLNVIKTILLSEDNDIKENAVYKYQSAADILKKLISEDIENTDGGVDPAKGAALTAVYSPVKRALKTSFSYTYAQIIAERRKCLYVNLEGCSGITELLMLKKRKNLADLVYGFSVRRKDFPGILSEYTELVEALHIIPPVEAISELQCIKPDEWKQLFKYLKYCSGFDEIVFDIGDNINGIMDILRICGKIYMPLRTDCISRAKVDAFEGALNKYPDASELKEKIQQITFPYFSDLGEGLMKLKYCDLGNYIRQKIAYA